MLKKPIKYEDFDGDEVTEDYYFNLTQSELMELIGSYGSVEKMQKAYVDASQSNDVGRMLAEFKKLVLLAYGEKSDDGKRFVKNDQMREAFTQTAAYDALFTEMTTDDSAFVNFIQAVIPQKLLKAMQDQDKPVGPPAAVEGPPSS